MAEPPRADPLRLTCYPIGSTSAGMPIPPSPAPPPPPAAMMAQEIVVAGAMRREAMFDKAMAAPVMAVEEALGDLKLYRVPMAVTVAAKAQKQVAFLSLDGVEGNLVHRADCLPDVGEIEVLADLVLRTRNLEENGLGRALPSGGLTLFEPSPYGPLLISEDAITDKAIGQEVEIAVAQASRVKVVCAPGKGVDPDRSDMTDGAWHPMEATVANSSGKEVEIELRLGYAGDWNLRRTSRKIGLQDGQQVMRARIPAGASRKVTWQARYAPAVIAAK